MNEDLIALIRWMVAQFMRLELCKIYFSKYEDVNEMYGKLVTVVQLIQKHIRSVFNEILDFGFFVVILVNVPIYVDIINQSVFFCLCVRDIKI